MVACYRIESELSQSYRDVHAVRPVSLRVKRGEIYDFLGPSGAVGSRAEMLGTHSYIVVILASLMGLGATSYWWRSADHTR